MIKFLKIILLSFAILVFVALVAGIIFVKTFDVNRFKPQILT
jgi:uncharacterized protein involved in outer membrane biogenesis